MAALNRPGLCFLDRPALPRAIELVRLAEARGFESAWVCETRLARDAISVLGAFAAVTERIKLGTGVINTWTRGPALTAVTFATLNELAPGRPLLGLGAYWDPLAWKQGIDCFFRRLRETHRADQPRGVLQMHQPERTTEAQGEEMNHV